jgi:hypothetical protein
VETGDFVEAWLMTLSGLIRIFNSELTILFAFQDLLDGDRHVHPRNGGWICGFDERKQMR